MKTFIFSILLAVFISLNIKAQQIPNGEFENWTHQTFNEPNGFLTSNSMWGINNVTKVSDSYHNLFAVKLETVLSNNGTAQGMLLIGTPGNQTINGGIPYTETPDSISGYVKFNVQLHDTAYFIVAFKKNGAFIGQSVKQFIGTQSVYKRFSIPTYLNTLVPPDTMVVIITSSSMNPPQIVGSTLTIDSITFLHSSQPFPNGDFENWTAINTDEDPAAWGTYANQFPFYHLPVFVTKTTDAHSGSFAVKLISDTATVQPPFGTGTHGDTILGTLQLNLINGFSSTKYPFAFRPDSLVGYLKGTVAAVPNNFNLILVQFTKNNVQIGQGYIIASSVSNYTRSSSAINYTSSLIPDSMSFVIYAGNPGNPVPGNIFYVDDISFIYNPTDIDNISEKSTCSIYPNPATNYITINTNTNATIEIYNIQGQIVKIMTNTSTINTLDIKDLAYGIYTIKIKSGDEILFKKLIKQ